MSLEHGDQSRIKLFLNSDDPLSADVINDLIMHKEEDLYVDYKESFDPQDEKHWLGITTDAMAFANTMGGYIVFGVRDSDFSVVSISEPVIQYLIDTNLVIQKLNRYVLPPFSMIRTKRFDTEGGASIVIMYVPESKGKTHIFIKDVSYKYPSGESKVLIRAGMVFIRRSATNHVVEPDDLEFIINRRIDYYKESILNKITKVVEAPVGHQLLIFDPKSKANNDKTYFISDSPDAIPVRGMSFTVVPRTDIEEVCGWIALSKRDPSFAPNNARLWYLYSVRSNLQLNAEQILEIIRFSLLGEMPIFFWLKPLSADQIKPVLLKVFDGTKNMRIKTDVLDVGAFLGSTFYNKILKKFGETAHRLSSSYRNYRKYPSNPFELFNRNLVGSDNRDELEIGLTNISKELSEQNDVIKRLRVKAIDCYLYARNDKYIGR